MSPWHCRDGTSIILSDDVGQLYILNTGQGESQKDAKYDQVLDIHLVCVPDMQNTVLYVLYTVYTAYRSKNVWQPQNDLNLYCTVSVCEIDCIQVHRVYGSIHGYTVNGTLTYA